MSFDLGTIFNKVGEVFSDVAANMVGTLDYNNKRNYSKNAIRIIQKEIGATVTGEFDAQTIVAIINWQKSPYRLKKLEADGMFGISSLGVMIAEMEHKGNSANAAVLRKFPHRKLESDIQYYESENPVTAFFQFPVSKLDLRPNPANPSRWIMKGSFKVEVYLDHQILEPERYEYRQFIKGRVFTHDGYFGDSVNKTHWQPRQGEVPVEANEFMQIPGGLNLNKFEEDGQVLPGNRIARFGYRSNPYLWEEGIMDFYSNDQKGYEYRLQDTFGIEGPRKRDMQGNFRMGLKIGVALHFRGIIIKDGKTPTTAQINQANWKDYCVATKEWSYVEEKIANW